MAATLIVLFIVAICVIIYTLPRESQKPDFSSTTKSHLTADEPEPVSVSNTQFARELASTIDKQILLKAQIDQRTHLQRIAATKTDAADTMNAILDGLREQAAGLQYSEGNGTLTLSCNVPVCRNYLNDPVITKKHYIESWHIEYDSYFSLFWNELNLLAEKENLLLTPYIEQINKAKSPKQLVRRIFTLPADVDVINPNHFELLIKAECNIPASFINDNDA